MQAGVKVDSWRDQYAVSVKLYRVVFEYATVNDGQLAS